MWYITLPGITGTIALMGVLNIGNLLNTGFDQILNLYSPQVYESGDIIDTFVYRFGLLEAKYGPSQAVSLVKSVISSALTIFACWLTGSYANYTLFNFVNGFILALLAFLCLFPFVHLLAVSFSSANAANTNRVWL